MLFCSSLFLFGFLPITLVLYKITPSRAKNYTLLASSIAFYAMTDISHLWLLLLTVAVNYILCKIGAQYPKSARAMLSLCLIYDISVLFIFKYLGFFGIEVALPVGISFYTFQCISYAKDVYDGDRGAKNLPEFSAYITMFPQLIAGPIVKYSDIDEQLRVKNYQITEGVMRFSLGLGKKMILANYAGELFIRGFSTETALGGWIGILGYAFQIYFDFSGYSDMAIGLGKLLGFDFPENFNYPYISKSIKEFWKRWHITLSSFFRDYLYIPLGGSRCSRLRNTLNLLLVWSLTGLWHGASLNFLLWGLYFFLLLSIERTPLYKKTAERMPVFVRRTVTFILILFGWLIFASEDMGLFGERLRILFLSQAVSPESLWLLLTGAVFLLLCAILSTPYPMCLLNRYKRLRAPAVIAIFIVSVAYVGSSGYNPFLYFRF